MDRLQQLIELRNPALLRRFGLGVDHLGRLVSIHEARAVASNEIKRVGGLRWSWPFRDRWSKRIQALGMRPAGGNPPAPRRVARGTEAPGVYVDVKKVADEAFVAEFDEVARCWHLPEPTEQF